MARLNCSVGRETNTLKGRYSQQISKMAALTNWLRAVELNIQGTTWLQNPKVRLG
jgi:hypothetical protein